MKKINYIILGMALLGLSSCFKKDNYDGPDSGISGKIIDSYTGQPLLSSQNDWQLRIWEKSWTASTAVNQNIPIKQDGTYNNSKLFAGTYDMSVNLGPFWPIDTAKNVVFGKGGKQQDFTVTPYLQVVDFTTTVVGTNLTMTCRLKAPKRVLNGKNLPDLYDIKPYLSLTSFVGESNNINIPEYTGSKIIQIRKSWIVQYGDVDYSPVITLGPLIVKSGYTYNVRIGANVNIGSRPYNYSEIKQVIVP
ncbi:MAG: DUF3823 domain-containing protein [Chitinophagaceae bacterium]